MSDIASADRVSAATEKADFGPIEVCLPEAWVNLARPCRVTETRSSGPEAPSRTFWPRLSSCAPHS